MRRRSSLRAAGMAGTWARPVARSARIRLRTAVVSARGVPQPVQKTASGARVRPQVAHGGFSSAPQPPQNRSPSPAWRPQRAH
ncbi:hypothetical protein GCM10010170_004600 [Dactylosporangium salmoneum]|uniref:Uncharacterized protein n=1 Tax=Dactylosporangium salmoneum TaxID=53361 RepID=A0ABN3FE64_9ACTN